MTEQEFKNHVFYFVHYDPSLLEQFFDYWSEPNKKGKMRFELEKTWDTCRRLKRWQTNNINWNKNNFNATFKKSSTAELSYDRP